MEIRRHQSPQLVINSIFFQRGCGLLAFNPTKVTKSLYFPISHSQGTPPHPQHRHTLLPARGLTVNTSELVT